MNSVIQLSEYIFSLKNWSSNSSTTGRRSAPTRRRGSGTDDTSAPYTDRCIYNDGSQYSFDDLSDLHKGPTDSYEREFMLPLRSNFRAESVGRQADRAPTGERLNAHTTVVATSDQATAGRGIFGLPPSITRRDLSRIHDLPTDLRPTERHSACYRMSEDTEPDARVWGPDLLLFPRHCAGRQQAAMIRAGPVSATVTPVIVSGVHAAI